MTAIVDKETLRHSLKEFAINEPDFVNSLIKEIEAEWEKEDDFEKILKKTLKNTLRYSKP